MDRKDVFVRFQEQGFIKTTDRPLTAIGSAQKAALNRKGNELINAGDVEGARRIFQTTGYSDGLIRVGDRYLAAGKTIEALKMYWIAPDKKKAETLIAKISTIIQQMVDEEMSGKEEG